MNLPFLLPLLAATNEALPVDQSRLGGNQVLLAVFAFIICLIVIRGYFRQRRVQMWHETARIALEKGQPIPSQFGLGMGGRGFRRWGAWWELRRGIVLLAVGGGLWLGHGAPMAWTILVCLGAAYVLLGLIALLRADQPPPSSDFREPPAKP